MGSEWILCAGLFAIQMNQDCFAWDDVVGNECDAKTTGSKGSFRGGFEHSAVCQLSFSWQKTTEAEEAHCPPQHRLQVAFQTTPGWKWVSSEPGIGEDTRSLGTELAPPVPDLDC
eukprot:g28629.t1